MERFFMKPHVTVYKYMSTCMHTTPAESARTHQLGTPPLGHCLAGMAQVQPAPSPGVRNHAIFERDVPS